MRWWRSLLDLYLIPMSDRLGPYWVHISENKGFGNSTTSFDSWNIANMYFRFLCLVPEWDYKSDWCISASTLHFLSIFVSSILAFSLFFDELPIPISDLVDLDWGPLDSDLWPCYVVNFLWEILLRLLLRGGEDGPNCSHFPNNRFSWNEYYTDMVICFSLHYFCEDFYAVTLVYGCFLSTFPFGFREANLIEGWLASYTPLPGCCCSSPWSPSPQVCTDDSLLCALAFSGHAKLLFEAAASLWISDLAVEVRGETVQIRF